MFMLSLTGPPFSVAVRAINGKDRRCLTLNDHGVRTVCTTNYSREVKRNKCITFRRVMKYLRYMYCGYLRWLHMAWCPGDEDTYKRLSNQTVLQKTTSFTYLTPCSISLEWLVFLFHRQGRRLQGYPFFEVPLQVHTFQ